MAVITLIDGVPLYTTTQEALDWGEARGLSTFHSHEYEGSIGYMGGDNHQQAFLESTNFITQADSSVGSAQGGPAQGVPIGGGGGFGGGGGGGGGGY